MLKCGADCQRFASLTERSGLIVMILREIGHGTLASWPVIIQKCFSCWRVDAKANQTICIPSAEQGASDWKTNFFHFYSHRPHSRQLCNHSVRMPFHEFRKNRMSLLDFCGSNKCGQRIPTYKFTFNSDCKHHALDGYWSLSFVFINPDFCSSLLLCAHRKFRELNFNECFIPRQFRISQSNVFASVKR